MGLSCTFDVKINTRAKASQNEAKKAAAAPKPNLRQASLEAIPGIKSRTGTSARKIVAAVKAATGSTNEAAIKRALKSLVASGALVNAKGQGIAGSLKISPAESARRKKAASGKKAAAKAAARKKKQAAAKKAKAAAKKRAAAAKKKAAAAKKKAAAAKKK